MLVVGGVTGAIATLPEADRQTAVLGMIAVLLVTVVAVASLAFLRKQSGLAEAIPEETAKPSSNSALAEPALHEFVVTRNVFSRVKTVCADVPADILDEKLTYADNKQASDTLIVLVSGLGLDHRDYLQYVASDRKNRCIAVSLYGFQPRCESPVAVSLATHGALLAEFVNYLRGTTLFKRAVYVGFSAGTQVGDAMLASRLLNSRLDGMLALDANISEKTCFVSGAIASLRTESPDSNVMEVIGQLSRRDFLGVNQWLNMHRYLVNVFTKFTSEKLLVLRRFAQEVYGPYTDGTLRSFLESYERAANETNAFLFVFSENRPGTSVSASGAATQINRIHISEVKRVLSEPDRGTFREGTLRIEPNSDHFDLIDDHSILRRNLSLLLERLA